MFAKLLKYEWRSNAGTCGILSLCVLGVSVLGGFALRYIVISDENARGSAVFSLGMLLMLAVLSLIAYGFAIYILQLVRFYKNKFTDEGYLTFTLPVTAHQIFLSSAVNLLIWMLISGLVLGLCLLIMGLFATVGIDYPIMEDVSEMLGTEALPDGYGLVMLLSRIVSVVFGVVMPLTCLTVGACVAKKHKIMAAFGIYYVISMVMSFLQGVMQMASMFGNVVYSEEDFMQLEMENAVIAMAAQLIVAVAGYFLSTGLMKKKLNLN